MATSTFERKISIKSPNAMRRLSRAMDKKVKTDHIPVYSSEERRRSEELLKQLISPSKQ
ncbi:MAG: hypothetical protein PUA88_00030 [Bacillales bacterium]|nr:hypothetical protein [Bacillales bacterium]